jgi:hypothetical protein
MVHDNRHTGLEYLLDLHGVIQVQSEQGHWVKFEVIRVPSSMLRPHGIKYSLTLHALDGTRLMGFDNAHPVKASRPCTRHAGQVYPYDHWHRHGGDQGVLYEFDNAYQLMEDFFTEVERVLKKECG